jgi:hypothetical protein
LSVRVRVRKLMAAAAEVVAGADCSLGCDIL